MALISESEYYNIIRQVPIVCVDVAIIRGGQILLVRRGNKPAQGQWWFPGGRVWKGEMLTATAKRKAKEEAGLVGEVRHIIHTAETIFSDGPGGISIHSVNAIFVFYPYGLDDVVLDNNHSAYKWINANEPQSSELWDNLNEYIKEGLRKYSD